LRLLQAPDGLDQRRRGAADVEADLASQVAALDGAGAALGLARGQPALGRVVAQRLLVVQRQREARADPAIERLAVAVAAGDRAAVAVLVLGGDIAHFAERRVEQRRRQVEPRAQVGLGAALQDYRG